MNTYTHDLDGEVWSPIRGFEGIYAVSNLGRVRSLPRRWHPRGTIVSQSNRNEKGYLRVNLYRDGELTTTNVHLLVLEAFHGPRPDGLEARHLDGDKKDNRAEKLAWGTKSENVLDQVRHGTHQWSSRTHCPQQHPYDEKNTYLHTTGSGTKRKCRACRREQSRATYYRNKSQAA